MKASITYFKKAFHIVSTVVMIIFIAAGCKGPAADYDNLKSGFVNPPESSKPRVWWHWMNGNITKEGIRADLEWMHRTGIGGFQNFDASLMTPQVVDKRLVYMTDDWKDAFRFTTKLADSLGLEMAIAGSPGWSESGGPWVKPNEAMKKYVWSELRVEGGKNFSGKLPAPPIVTGPFQNISFSGGVALNGNIFRKLPEYYADAAIVACRLANNDFSMETLNPKVTSSGGRFDLKMLTDGDLATSSFLPAVNVGQDAWIRFEFQKPETMDGLTIVGGGSAGMFGFGADQSARGLESSNDGRTWEKVTSIPRAPAGQLTMSFNPVTAKYFRFTWTTPTPAPRFSVAALLGIDEPKTPPAPAGTNIAELVLHTVPVVNRLEDKAAFTSEADLYKFATPNGNSTDVIMKDDVIDLSSLMKPDGSLEWTAPEGNWVIIRLGYSLTGHENAPASQEATGLEVDKLNAGHVKSYFTNYLDQYKDATGGLMGSRGLKYMITDSWEAGVQNWTDSMITEFKNHRGYSLIPWIPVLTGRIVESTTASDKFLWDLRRTISDLTAVNHYDQLTDILKERGMGRYTESHESGRAFIADGMEVKRKADIPMSATWTPGGFTGGDEVSTGYKADVRESASVAHLYGQNLVAAESMTAIGTAWAWSPELLKPTADMEMANGLNRFVIHTSVHQPVNDKIPGLGLGPFGQWFTRHETWAEQAAPWIGYLSRSCYMLQQGKFVADIAWFYGEDNNVTALFGSKLPDVPEGYNYDFVNADALLNLLKVKDGLIVSPSGASYKLLVLDPNSRYMTLPVLRKIEELVKAGAVIAGQKPIGSPSMTDNPKEFSELADQLWDTDNGVTATGNGKIFAGMYVGDVLNTLNIKPDFEYSGSMPDSRLLFVHRKMNDMDIYWVNSRQKSGDEVVAKFRVEGKAAEIWHPETGRIEKAVYSQEDGMTKVPLSLVPDDAVFIVFSGKAENNVIPSSSTETELATLSGEWILHFQKDRGAPDTIKINQLFSWPGSSNTGVKYFSGTCTYEKRLDIQKEWTDNNKEIWIDLGDVKNLAEVVVNGKSAGIVWKKPFKTEISGLVTPGENKLEIRVTNLWVNRLIGDAQPGVTKKFTYTTMPFYMADSPLLQSGLLGPVKLTGIEQ